MNSININTEKKVTVIPATKPLQNIEDTAEHPLRVAAYCRVSTEMEEQLNSYVVQTSHYTERIHNTPNWEFAGVFADRGISGTAVKNRDEFNRMIRYCKRGKIDMILTKSVSRFARNTLDCIKYVRLLKDLGVDVYFEEQGLHSIKAGSEFLIAIFGSQAQAESENQSANVRWGMDKAAQQGKIAFPARMYGYLRHSDGTAEIVAEEAEVVRRIFDDFLNGDTAYDIRKNLEKDGILSPGGNANWQKSTIDAILRNEKYIGDYLTNKTFRQDCLTKKVRRNNGQRVQYYIEDHHPAIISRTVFQKTQEEIKRRTSFEPKSEYSSKTGAGKYRSKYLLTEILICGTCGVHYKRVSWSIRGKRKIVWRCINRLQGGPKRCGSPTIEEETLHAAIMSAVMQLARENKQLLEILKEQIREEIMQEESIHTSIETLRNRIVLIDAEVDAKINSVNADNIDDYDDSEILELLTEKNTLEKEIQAEAEKNATRKDKEERVQEVLQFTDMLKNHPMKFDDKMMRKILKRVEILSAEEIEITFTYGQKVRQKL